MLLGGENTSTDCSPAPTTWQLDHPRVSKVSERRYYGNCGVLYSLALKVLHCHFHDIPLVTQVSPVPRGWDHCGLSWRLAEGRMFFFKIIDSFVLLTVSQIRKTAYLSLDMKYSIRETSSQFRGRNHTP